MMAKVAMPAVSVTQLWLITVKHALLLFDSVLATRNNVA